MNGVELRLMDKPEFDLDISDLIPEKIAGKSLDTIKRIRLSHGNRRIALGDLFELNEIPDETIMFNGATRKLRRIGRGMTSGTIEVRGNAGDELGSLMSGGTIKVRGSAGDYVGGSMHGGAIEISGSTGDFTGGALPSSPLGMRNGLIRVGKDVGGRTGDRMRRGLIIVNGDAGGYCGTNMVAGTIIVAGRSAPGIGLGMRRGTIVALQAPSELPATFNDCGTYSLAILAVLSAYVRSIDRRAFSRLRAMSEVRRFTGDIGCNGQGEILTACQT